MYDVNICVYVNTKVYYQCTCIQKYFKVDKNHKQFTTNVYNSVYCTYIHILQS